MTRAAVEQWLAARQPLRPTSLELQMTRSIAACAPGSIEAAPTMAAALGLVGVAVLDVVAAAPSPSPELAMQLLAADAFVTYAFEAAAEEGVSVAPMVAQLLAEVA